MKVNITIVPPDAEEEVQFCIHGMSEPVVQAIQHLTSPGTELKHLMGKNGEKHYRITIADMYYVEAVERKVFAYTEKQTFEVGEKLYVLEEQLSAAGFIRVSKSMLLNLDKIQFFSPKLSGNLEALLANGEKVAISRRYVPELKRKLGMRDAE